MLLNEAVLVPLCYPRLSDVSVKANPRSVYHPEALILRNEQVGVRFK